LEPRPKTLEVTERSRATKAGGEPRAGVNRFEEFTSSTWWSTSCPKTSCRRSYESSPCCCSSWPWRLTSFL